MEATERISWQTGRLIFPKALETGTERVERRALAELSQVLDSEMALAVQGGGGRGGNAAQGRLQSANFVTAIVAPATPDETLRKRAANHPVTSAPVSIESKPTPVYTPEARQLRIEGEVLLNVVFTAGGRIRILSVVRGLGHGLDESAQRAAQGVRFSPAMRDGHPVDSNATLHIIFQLS